MKLMKQLVLLLSLVSLSAWATEQYPSAQAPANQQAYSKEAQKVVMFSATYCPACRQVKQYLTARDIPFIEYDIEKSEAARAYFYKLGGRGTPLMVVNSHVMQGFSESRFWHYYGSR